MVRLLLGLLLASFSAATMAGGVIIEACTYVGEDGAILRFRLKNDTGREIFVPGERLPWAVDGAIVLAYGGTAINGSIMRRVYPVQDSFSSDIGIRPGEERVGNVFLDLIFPDISKRNHDDRVTIFWSYPDHGLDFDVAPMGGVLTLGRESRCGAR